MHGRWLVLICKLKISTLSNGGKLWNCIRLGFPFYLFAMLYTCCNALLSGKVTSKQCLTCVAVNEVFGNRERLVLAGAANSAACSSLASSSSNNSETAMESWRTKPHKIKVIKGTTTRVFYKFPCLEIVHRNDSCHAICSLLHLKETWSCG